MAGDMQCRVITHFAELEGLSGEWDRLWASNPHRQIFGRFAWARAWWQGYGPSVALCTPVVLQNDRVVGILPLVRHNALLRFLGEPGSDYNDILCDGTAAAGILEVLLQAICGMSRDLWRSATFANVPEHSLFLALLGKLPGHWRPQLVTSMSHFCPSVILDDENRETTLRTILGQREPRQHERKLQKLGKLTFRHIEDRAEIRRHLPVYFEQHTQRWAMVVGGNLRFSSEQSRTFYEALVEQLDPRNELRFAVMEMDGRPIAYHFGFQLDGKFILYKTTFDINLWEESPGQVMIRSLFSYAQSMGVKEFDFTIGNETYKNRLANHTNRNFTIRLYRPGLMSLAERKLFLLSQRLDREQRPPFVQLRTVKATVLSHAKRVRELLQRDGLRKLLGKVAVAAFRTLLFASDEVLLFSLDRRVSSRLGVAPHLDLNLSMDVATLGDLANCSAKEPGILDRSKLQCARVRSKKGDVSYITRAGGRLECLVWVGTRNELTPLELGLDCHVPLEKPVAVIYDLWIAPSLRSHISPDVLRAMACASHEKGLDTWISCGGKDVVLRQAIEAAGFSMRHRITRTRLFGLSQTRSQPVILETSHGSVQDLGSDLGLMDP
jgi:CelD/BcsL family acetyltransferase involved in cellulose biosynthesis